VLEWGPSSDRAAQMRLERLHDSSYVDRFRPAHAYGRVERYYRLASQGFSMLSEREMVPAVHSHTPAALTSISYAGHDSSWAP